MDETVGIFAARNSVRQLALGGEIAENVLALDSLIKVQEPQPEGWSPAPLRQNLAG